MYARGRDRRQLGDDAMREDFAVARIVDVGGVVIEGRHRGDHRRDHGHGVRIVVKAQEKAQQLLVDHGVAHDRILKRFELRFGGQISVDQQIRDLQEARLLRQLFDRIPSIQQHACVAVDIRDLALGAGGGHEARIVGKDPEILRQIRNIDHVRADGPGPRDQFDALSGGEILEFVFRAHARSDNDEEVRRRPPSLARSSSGIKRVRRACARRIRAPGNSLRDASNVTARGARRDRGGKN